MILSLTAASLTALAPALADELEKKAKFCLAVPAHPEVAENLLTHVRERHGWSRIDENEIKWNGTKYSIRTYRNGTSTVKTAIAAKKDRAFCRYSLRTSSSDVENVVDSVKKIYLRRAMVSAINPYELETGVGERIHFAIVYISEDARELRITVSTHQASAPF